jgi:hypothetical protein
MLAFAAMAGVASGQGAYPSKPIKLIAPVQPGGGVDLVARQIGERITKALGQPVVVENQSGGGGIVVAGYGACGTRRLHLDGWLRRHARHQSGGAQAAYDAVKGFPRRRNGRGHAERARSAALPCR